MNIFDNTKKRPGNVFILLMFIVCITAGTLVACGSKSKDVSKTDSTAEATEAETEEGLFTPSGTAGILHIYTDITNSYPFADKEQDLAKLKNVEYAVKVGKYYPCTTSDATFLCGYNSKILVKDGGYFIYDYKTDKAKEVLLPDGDYSSFIFVYDTSTKKILGLGLTDSKQKSAFYSFKTQKFVTDFSYSSIDNQANRNYLFASGTVGENCILDIDTGKVLFNVETGRTGECSFISNENSIYFLVNDASENSYDIYNENFTLILGKNKSLNNQVTISDNGYVTVIDANGTTYSSYDQNGELVSQSRSYEKVFLLNEHYVGVVDMDNYLKIIDMNNDAEMKKFVEWTDNMRLNDCNRRYYHSTDYPAGLYFFITDSSVAKNIKGYYKQYYYNPENGNSGELKYKEFGTAD